MALIRRGYVPTSIPITAELFLSHHECVIRIPVTRISCFEEYETEDRSQRFCSIWTHLGARIRPDQSFDTVVLALSELVIDDDIDVDPSCIGVEAVYAEASPRKGA